MSYQTEQILSQFKDSGVPKTGLSPLITIRETNGTVVVNGQTMIEITNGWYEYNFTSYEKSKTYLIDVDGTATLGDSDRYQHTTNILDAYTNKRDWKGSGGGGPVINTKQMAKEIRLEKTKDYTNKKGTMGQKLTEINNDDVLEMIEKIELPDNKKDLLDIKSNQQSIKSNQEKMYKIQDEINENIVDTVNETIKTGVEMNESIKNATNEIKDEVVFNKTVVSFDYERLEKSIEDSKESQLPILNAISILSTELKESISNGIKNNEKVDVKEYILKSLENQRLFEIQKENKKLQDEFNNSINIIKGGIDKLQEKEVDFNPILETINTIKENIDKGNKDIENGLLDVNTKEQIERNYKKTIEYITLIARNISTIGKKDINEIKSTLSKLK